MARHRNVFYTKVGSSNADGVLNTGNNCTAFREAGDKKNTHGLHRNPDTQPTALVIPVFFLPGPAEKKLHDSKDHHPSVILVISAGRARSFVVKVR